MKAKYEKINKLINKIMPLIMLLRFEPESLVEFGRTLKALVLLFDLQMKILGFISSNTLNYLYFIIIMWSDYVRNKKDTITRRR